MSKTERDACGTCGSTKWSFWRKTVNEKKVLGEICSDCSTVKMPSLAPDVYFDASKGSNQTDPNLCDRYKGKIPFSSKREKAAIMKSKGIREAGDPVHGGRDFDKQGNKGWEGA